MSEAKIPADEVAQMVAARQAIAEGARAQEARDEELAAHRPVPPSARGWWRFGVELRESDEGSTLVIRCYPRKRMHSEEVGPFHIGPRGWLLGLLGVALEGAALVLAPGWGLRAAVVGLVSLAMLVAHYARVVRIHITRRGHFLVYERDPRRPIGIGPVDKLWMDARDASMRCEWVVEEGQKWVRKAWFGLEDLPRADWLLVQKFIARHRLRGL